MACTIAYRGSETSAGASGTAENLGGDVDEITRSTATGSALVIAPVPV